MQAELDAARADAVAATRVASQASIAIPDVGESTQSELRAVTAEDGNLREAAREAYDAINDLLSELRNNVIIVQSELPRLQSEPATMRAVSDAVDAIVDGAENAKGALRGLRDIADSGNT